MHPLVNVEMLGRLRVAVERAGAVIIERIPSNEEVSTFFSELETISEQPLSERLQFNGEDGTVFVKHKQGSQVVHLCTVAHDYTRVGRDSFDDGWHDMGKHPVAAAAVSLLDDLQRHLLRFAPAFFHSASRGVITLGDEDIYTLRAAYRRASHIEPVITESAAMAWRPLGWNGIRSVTPAEATVWAVAHLVPTNSMVDSLRLRRIHAVIRAVFHTTPKRRVVPQGNSIALLAARLPPAHDPYGRVRYPVLRSAACDASVLTTLPRRSFFVGAEEPLKSIPRIVPRSVLPIFRIIISFILFVSFTIMAVLFTSERYPQLVRIFLWSFVALTALELLYMIYLSRSASLPKSPSDLIELTKRDNIRLQVDVACCLESRLYFNGKGLSFCERRYLGVVDFPGKQFSISDLMIAGYETTYAMDGREALLTPLGNVMRLVELDESGRALFDAAESTSSDFAHGVLSGVRGTWLSDVDVSTGIRPSSRRILHVANRASRRRQFMPTMV